MGWRVFTRSFLRGAIWCRSESSRGDQIPGVEGGVSLQSRRSFRWVKHQLPSIFANVSRYPSEAGQGFQLQALCMPNGFETVVEAPPRAANCAAIAVLSSNSHVGQPQRASKTVRRCPGVVFVRLRRAHLWTRTDLSICRLSTRATIQSRLLPRDPVSDRWDVEPGVELGVPVRGNQMMSSVGSTASFPPVLRRSASSKWAGQYPAPNQTKTQT